MCLPMIFSIIPIFVTIMSPFVGIALPGLGILVTLAFSWVPLISPITTILLVTSFRRRTIKFLTLPYYITKGKIYGTPENGAWKINESTAVYSVQQTVI